MYSNSSLRRALQLGVAVAALVQAAPVLAQETQVAVDVVETEVGERTVPEIIVTAQKTETNLQKTPISISVLSAVAMTDRHALSIADLGDGSIPSLRVAPFFARRSALTIGMRGIGALGDANQPARDQAVGVYIDGVYLGRAQGLGSALYDVERIEVLKGPQGTLFGRNTEGGAVSIVTRAPSGEFHSNTTIGYGNYHAYDVATHLDLPAFGNIAVKLDGVVSKRDGTVENPTTSGQPDFNSYDRRGLHGEALWTVNDTFTADYAFDVSYDGSTPYYVQLLGRGSLPLAPIIQVQSTRAEVANVGVPLRTSVGHTQGHRLTLDWYATPELEVQSIASYRRLKQGQFDNGASVLSVYAPNGAFSRYSLAQVWQHQVSEELQVLGKFDNFSFVAGGFYYHEAVRDNAQTPNTLQFNATGTSYTTLSVDLNTVPYDRASHVKTDSQGAFGQATWTPAMLGEIAHLTVGGRYTHDKKSGDLDTVNGALPSYVNANGQTIVGIIPLNAAWSRFDPMVNLAIDVSPDVNVYGKWSEGYKSGGANSRSLTYRAFAPETVSMFEVGAKTEFLERRARLNVAAYTGSLKNVQVDFNAIIPGNNRGTLETTNAATGRTKGVEVDLTVVPLEGLTLTASYAYTKMTLSRAFNPFTNGSAVIYPLYTPPNAVSFGGDYETPVGNATLRLHLDGNLADAQYTSTTDPTLSDKSFIVNGRIAITDIRVADSNADLEISLWSRNLLNKQYAFLRNFSAALGTYGIFNEPRTFGIEGRVKF